METLTSTTEAFGQDVFFVDGFTVSEHTYKVVQELEKENARLREFKEFTNMMIRRNLNHTCSDYEAIMAIDEKLTGE